MSCQVYAKKGEELEEIYSSHNGLLYALTALCFSEEEYRAYGGNNDITLNEEQLRRGIHVLTFNFPDEATPAGLRMFKERPDHITQAAVVLGLIAGAGHKEVELG